MKTILKKVFFIIISAFLFQISTFGAGTKIGVLYYNLNSGNRTAEVTYQYSDSEFNYLGLSSVSIPSTVEYNGISYSVTSIGYSAFEKGIGVTSVTIPNSVTEIGYNAFRDCSGLKNIKIPNSITSIGASAFMDCTGLAQVFIDDLDAWCMIQFNSSGSNPLEYAHHLYLNGKEIKDLIIPNSITSIGKYTFANCSELTSVTIPNTVTSIKWMAFIGCSGLTSVTIPSSVTEIGYAAFSGCKELKSITFNSDQLLNIDNYAFSNCYDIECIYCNTKTPPVANNFDVFADDVYFKAALYVPDKDLSLYYSTVPWSKFGIIFGLDNFPGTEQPSVSSVTLNFESVELTAGQTFQLMAEVLPLDAPDRTIVWSSSNENVAMVSQSGLVVAISTGEAVVTATCGAKSASCNVSVVKDNSSVDTMFDNSEIFSVYTLNGILIKEETTADYFNSLSPGIYILRDASGNTRKLVK